MKNEAFKHNFHSHTSRCGHALGRDEDYVKAAIKAGMKTIGFSDHAMLPKVVQIPIRGDYSLLDDYINSVHELQRKYKGKIEILLSFECEYCPTKVDYYKSLLDEKGFDYLIQGQHCFLYYGEMVFYDRLKNRHLANQMYVEDTIKGMESGLFTYLCHPDLFMLWSEWNEETKEMSLEIIDAAERLHIPLEINLARARSDYIRAGLDDTNLDPVYPRKEFWDLVKGRDIDVIFGVDAHNPEDYELTPYDWGRRFAEERGLRVIDTLPFNKL